MTKRTMPRGDDACLDYLWRRLSDDGESLMCPGCGHRRRFRRVNSRPAYRCAGCGKDVYPTSGTIFARSATPLSVWFRAVEIVAGGDGVVTARDLEHSLGVTYKTAWRMSQLIRQALDGPNGSGAVGGNGWSALDQVIGWRPPPSVRVAPAPFRREVETGRELGRITTFAGDGTDASGGDGGQAGVAQLRTPVDVAADHEGNVFIADSESHVVRRVDGAGIISTVAGNGKPGYSGDGGPAARASLCNPGGLALDRDGRLLIADLANHAIRRVDRAGRITTIAGNGERGWNPDGTPAAECCLNAPSRLLCVDGRVIVSEWGGQWVRRIDEDGLLETVAGVGTRSTFGDGGPATEAGVAMPCGLAADADGNLYVAQLGQFETGRSTESRVRRIDRNGLITTFAGGRAGGPKGDGGPAVDAWLAVPTGLAWCDGALLICDQKHSRIRRVGPGGVIETIVGTGVAGFDGNGGPAVGAELHDPNGLAVTANGDLLIADTSNHRIRVVAGPVRDLVSGPVSL